MACFLDKLNRFKFLALPVFFSAPFLAQAQVSLVSLSISNSNPAPGSVVAVTVVYCDQNPRTPFWLVALNPGSTSIQSCPTANQHLLVDGNTAPTGVSAVSSNQDDASDTSGSGNGWAGVPVPSASTCNFTQVFNVTIPSTLGSGSYNLIVKTNDYFVQCTSAGVQLSTTITVPLPPPGISLVKTADGSTANPGDLVLFHLDYNYVNTGPVTITDNIPANTTLASGSGAMSPGGTLNGSTITWILPATSGPQSGEVWFLTKVNGGTPAGTVITNAAQAGSANAGPVVSNVAQVNVGVGGFTLFKSVSNAAPSMGGTVTYALNYQVSGESLQSSDSFQNETAGTSNNSIQGYDGTGYTFTSPSGQGGFSVQTDSQGNNYLQACASNTCNSGTTVNSFPTLLRNGPSVNLCSNYMVEGDLQIPASAAPGADATMVLADNLSAPNVNDAYMVGMSLDCGPGNFYLQKNNSTLSSVTFPSTLCNSSLGITITAGVWYTVKVLISYSGTSLTFNAKIWPRGTPEPGAWSINYTDSSPLPCTPINGGKYLIGWQADGSSSTDYYTNMKVYGPSPVVNPRIWDTLPAGETFVASGSTLPTQQAVNYLEWDLGGTHPVTTFNVTGAVSVASVVAGCGTDINVAAVMGDGAASMVQSNPVTVSAVGGCPTNTPTVTPTVTNTATVTPTVTVTPTPYPILDYFTVSQNVFNPDKGGSVAIGVGYSKANGDYSLRIYNSAGEHIVTLDDGQISGVFTQSYTWNGLNKHGDKCASGIYIIELLEPLDTKFKRVILAR